MYKASSVQFLYPGISLPTFLLLKFTYSSRTYSKYHFLRKPCVLHSPSNKQHCSLISIFTIITIILYVQNSILQWPLKFQPPFHFILLQMHLPYCCQTNYSKHEPHHSISQLQSFSLSHRIQFKLLSTAQNNLDIIYLSSLKSDASVSHFVSSNMEPHNFFQTS